MIVVILMMPLAHNVAWQPVWDNKGMAVGFLVAIAVVGFFSLMLPAAGATRCPAAVSATVYTSSSMLTGYIAQSVLFDSMPTLLTLIGAGFMLLSVLMMSVPSRQQPQEQDAKCQASSPADATPLDVSQANAENEDWENMSLGSFVASEVSFLSGPTGQVRRRIGTGGCSQSGEPNGLAQVIGAVLPVVGMSV